MNERRTVFAMYMRNFVFGVEDSLVSTVGLLSGIAVADVPRNTLILTGVILIFVEAFSMATGSFLSEESAEEYLTHTKAPIWSTATGAAVMFVSYIVSGLVPLSPYLFFPVEAALWGSILFSLATLFLLGLIGAKAAKLSVFRGAFKMLAVGGIALLVGVVVGKVLSGSV